MQGILADVNVQKHLEYLQHRWTALNLRGVLADLGLSFVTFAELNLPRNLDDRSLWQLCQKQGWVLFTENRNHDGPNSLSATLIDLWQIGDLPILTLANKGRFEHDLEYANHVAEDIAELLFGLVVENRHRDISRIYIPRTVLISKT